MFNVELWKEVYFKCKMGKFGMNENSAKEWLTKA